MLPLTPTTELDAVNEMLGTIGQSPVSSIATSGNADVAIAKQYLTRMNRMVQAEGWDFNTEERYPIPLDVDSKVPLAENILSVDPSKYDHPEMQAVKRGAFLYDKKNHTFTFDKTVMCDVTFLLPFEDIPEAARLYIMIRAARAFQARFMVSGDVDGFTANDELMARGLMIQHEIDVSDPDMVWDSDSTSLGLFNRDR